MVQYKVFLVYILIVFTTITTIKATLHDFDLDLSNLDIASHKFFKNFPDLSKKSCSTIWEHIDQHFQKKKAVANYFGRLLFGTPEDNEIVKIEFDPNFGHAWRPYYQRRYGYRGKHFVESIGKGYSPIVERSTKSYNIDWSRKSKKNNKNFRILYH